MDQFTDQIVRKLEELLPVRIGGCKITTAEADEVSKMCKVYRVEIVVPYRNLSKAQIAEDAKPKPNKRVKAPFKIDGGTVSFK